MKKSKKPIIISGMPRTGTTPLGHIISSIDDFSMIYEPFNVNQGVSSIEFNYPYPGKNISTKRFYEIFHELIDFKSRFKKGININDSLPLKLFKYFIGNESSLSFYRSKFSKKTNLVIKDPFLVFATHELSSKYKIIFCERPLKPLCASFKRMKWDFYEYNKLSKLFYPETLRAKSFQTSENVSSYVIGAVQFYELIVNYKKKITSNDNIFFFSQDAFVKNNHKEMKRLFAWLNIEYSIDIQKKVDSLTNKSSSSIAPKENTQHDSGYNKAFSNKYFSEILTKQENELIDFFCSGGEI